MQIVPLHESGGDRSPLAAARLHRQQTVAAAARRAGIPEDEARYANEQFVAGRTLVTVKAVGRAGEATEILQRHGAHDIHADRPGNPPTIPPAPMGATNDEPVVVVSTGSPYRENRI
jgi:hypothetical protein